MAQIESGESSRAATARGSVPKRKTSSREGKVDVLASGEVTPRVPGGDVATLECWLNDMLEKAKGNKEIDSLAPKLQPAGKGGLEEAGLSRDKLLELGVPPKAVDRLYRAFYVYSVGFMETINEAFTHSEHRRRGGQRSPRE